MAFLSNPIDKIGVISFQRRDQNGNGTVTDPDELAEPKVHIDYGGTKEGRINVLQRVLQSMVFLRIRRQVFRS